MAKPKIHNILDVTLRDGGYLNKWQFSRHEITDTIGFLLKQGIRRIEVGFLRTDGKTTSEVNGCPAGFLEELVRQYPDMQCVGMLNPADDDWKEAVNGKLQYFSLVRLTCTADLIDRALVIADYLHQQSPTIKVSVNLICISSYQHDEIAALLKRIALSPNVDRLYFADSRGALRPQEIEPLIELARQHCDQPLGFHAHDTLGNAIENSNRAFACGCDLIDVSLNGFGLAGGNTPLAGYLKANSMVDASIETEALSFCRQSLPLHEAGMGNRSLFALLAQKNIDPVWSDELLAAYPDELERRVAGVSRKPYKTVDEVLADMKALTPMSEALMV